MSIEIVVLTTKWEGEQCVASAELFFMNDSVSDPIRILEMATHSANHNFLLQGAYGSVASIVRQVKDLTIEKLKSMLNELSEDHQWQWPEAIRESPKLS